VVAGRRYLLEGGNDQVILCERGIRGFEPSTRNTLDLSAVVIAKQRTHLPVIVDPSHATGRRELVIRLSLAAAAAGAGRSPGRSAPAARRSAERRRSGAAAFGPERADGAPSPAAGGRRARAVATAPLRQAVSR